MLRISAKIVIALLNLVAILERGTSQQAGYFSNWKEDVWTLGEGFLSFVKTVGNVGAIISDAVEEDCEYTCPRGLLVVGRPGHAPSSNGCGSYGLQVKDIGVSNIDFSLCCEAHDVCYDTCGSDKDFCDLDFKKCLYKQCKNLRDDIGLLELKKCKGAAKVMWTSIVAVGCRAFLDSQRDACQCIRQKPKPNGREEL